MSTLAELREGLQGRLATIEGLRAHALWPDTVIPPAAIVVPNLVGKDATLGGEQWDTFDVIVAVQATNLAQAQAAMDRYMSRSGADSIQAALEADGTLGGVAQFLVWDGWTEYGQGDINDVPHGIAKGQVRVWH